MELSGFCLIIGGVFLAYGIVRLVLAVRKANKEIKKRDNTREE